MSIETPDKSSTGRCPAVLVRSRFPCRAAGMFLAFAAALPLRPLPAQISLVSRAAASASAVGGEPAPFGLSADGRYVAFQSESNLLVPGTVDAPGTPDAFVFDRDFDTVELVSHVWNSPATAGNGRSVALQLSADGRFVLLLSEATNLVAGSVDANGGADLLLRDRDSGTTILVSHAFGSTTAAGNGVVVAAVMSSDGAVVAFSSLATNYLSTAVPNDASPDTYLWVLATGATTLVSHTPASPTTTANGASNPTSVSGDGGSVLFLSAATNMVAGVTDTNASADVFVYQRSSGVVQLVSRSVAPATAAGNGESSAYSISADGRIVLYNSQATDLVSGLVDLNEAPDVFLWNRDAAASQILSHSAASEGVASDGASFAYWSALAADGSVAAFASSSTDLVPGQIDDPDSSDAFLWRSDGDAVRLLSRQAGSPVAAAQNAFPAYVSADGETAIFNYYESASAIVPEVDDPYLLVSDLFVVQRGFETIRLVSRSAVIAAPTVANSDTYGRAISPDGRFVLADSFATDLVSGVTDEPDTIDVFLWRDPHLFADGFGTGTLERWSDSLP
jgi:hypothetical protein